MAKTKELSAKKYNLIVPTLRETRKYSQDERGGSTVLDSGRSNFQSLNALVSSVKARVGRSKVPSLDLKSVLEHQNVY